MRRRDAVVLSAMLGAAVFYFLWDRAGDWHASGLAATAIGCLLVLAPQALPSLRQSWYVVAICALLGAALIFLPLIIVLVFFADWA